MTRPPNEFEALDRFVLGAWLGDLLCKFLIVREFRRQMERL